MPFKTLEQQIRADLRRKMVFLAGPRQVGKTTLAKKLLGKEKNGYLNWDINSQREIILTQLFPATKMWVFDEIHKYHKWRNYLKGVYDEFHDSKKILVTGSARLDLYRRGGDSLQGRYHLLRMHPLSVADLGISTQADLMQLLKLGGFPEPWFSGSETVAARWSRDYRSLLIREEVASLENVHDLGSLENLYLRLPRLVGSPLSINALREDLQVSHKTVSHWLDIFERLYGIFRLSPFGAPRIRAVKKEQKHYHMDWSIIQDEGIRFENMVATHLLKWVHQKQDFLARELDLRYFRDIDKREVDFIITENDKPILAIECKWSSTILHPALRYFKQRFQQCRCIQLVANLKSGFVSRENIEVLPASKWLKELV